MSLLRLLTTGKSRYRMTSQRLLPQFGSAQNPFKDREKARPPNAEGCAPSETATGTDTTPAQSPTKPAAAPVSGPGPVRALRARVGVLLSGWKAKLTGLLARPRAQKPKSAILRFTKTPVQGELSLDRIKVVRNDLSDADLEVVPAKRSAARQQPEEKEQRFGGPEARATARIPSTTKA
jgi:hypothetical protein